MAISQARSKRTKTGSRYVDFRKKKQYECGREPTMTKVGPQKKRTLRVTGGDYKTILLDSNIVNVVDKKTGKCSKATIVSVKQNTANSNYVRRSILTKGCIVSTDKGDVKITSRPGQEGAINGYLVK